MSEITVKPATSFLDELHWRGLLHQATAGETLLRHLQSPGRVAYCGFDPTSDSLHIGNFIPIKLLMHWQRCGHKPIVVMGGGTGQIGDPSGRDEERQLLSRDQVEANIRSQKKIMERFLDFDPACPNAAVLVNNIDWLERLGYLQVLRDVGKHFSVNQMIQRDSVKVRLEQREHGISYTEFSYMILQAYDFFYLRRTMNCTVQLAGSDQYGNIVAGIDLIRREFGPEKGQAWGVTAPLVSRSDGRKMSKSAGEALWMSSDTLDRTTPYAFYQYWINLPDADVEQWLKWYTLLSSGEIEDVMRRCEAEPESRLGQTTLAREMTRLVHGEEMLERVEQASQVLFGRGDLCAMDEAMLADAFAEVPHSTHDRSLLEGEGLDLVELLPQTTLVSSKREAREFLNNGAVAVNGVKVNASRRLSTSDLLHGRTILLRRGKKYWHATEWK